MHAGPQGGCKPRIARHHQHEVPGPADPREIMAERDAVRGMIMPQNHAGDTGRELRDRRTRIGQPVGVGKQPERGQASAT
jgi:hypothetical protein